MKHLFLLALLCTACAPRSIESYHTAENDEEIVRLLNQRRYQKAVWLIESRHGKNPEEKNVAFLLGEAYLGLAGLEPLAIAAKVSASQSAPSSDSPDIFPSCSQESLMGKKNVEPLCMLKRVYVQLPDADIYELTRARSLFRSAYPNAASAPEWVNALIGAVETASVLKRVGKIYAFVRQIERTRTQPEEHELRWLVRQAKRVLEEGSQAFARADHAGQKISQLLTGNRDFVWFKRAREGIKWADRLGLGALFDLFRENVLGPEEQKQYGDMLDKIRILLDEQEKQLL